MKSLSSFIRRGRLFCIVRRICFGIALRLQCKMLDLTYLWGMDDCPSVHHRFGCQDFAFPFSNHCCEGGGVGGWHSREGVVSNLLAIKAGLSGPQRGPVLLVG